MKWLFTNNKDINKIQSINDNEKQVVLSFTSNNKNLYEIQGKFRYFLMNVNNDNEINTIKKYLINLQQTYDITREVRCFYINGKNTWFDKNTRIGLVNGINLQKQNGKTETTIWFGNNPITMSIDKAITFLAVLEDYAMQCYNITQSKIATINSLKTIEELVDFDITTGYPDKLKFEIE